MAVTENLPETREEALAEVVQLRQQVAAVDEVAAAAAQLRERVTSLLERITGPAPLHEVRQAMNDVGIADARRLLQVDAIDTVANALDTLRAAQDAERTAKEAYDDALLEAEWDLSNRFVVRSNKQWLAVDGAGAPIPEADQQSYDAAARKEWIGYHAARTAPVRAAHAALRNAQETTAQARDDVAIAEKRFTAAKHSLDAAAAQLHALVRATPREDLR